MSSTHIVEMQLKILAQSAHDFAKRNTKPRGSDHHESHPPKILRPTLAVIQAYETQEPADHALMVKALRKYAERCGIDVEVRAMVKNCSAERLMRVVTQANDDPDVHGILLPSPLPVGIKRGLIAAAVDPFKDVECVHPDNFEMFKAGEPMVWPPAAHGINQFLLQYKVVFSRRQVLVLGQRNTFSRSAAKMLQHLGCHVTFIEQKADAALPKAEIRRAEILVVDIRKPEVIRGEDLRDDVVIIDAGFHRVDGQVVGDVHFASASKKASLITPPKNGVGPLIVTTVLQNLLLLANHPQSRH